MPGTGSDPNPAAAQPSSGTTSGPVAAIDIWLFGLLALVVIGAGVTKRYVKF
ncbi:MAG TPA: hypothetical protein VNG51_12880 [Ktedonobacteraceae bacterium]|nr:hypothetical protein [Ktedonobacteraceae bacterium]